LADPEKRATLIALITNGVGRRTACRYVGVHFHTLARELERDPEFLDALLKAESAHESNLVKCIGKAARQERYWRAGAWKLERFYPSRYRPRPADSLSLDEFRLFLKYLSRVVPSALPREEDQERVRRSFTRVPDLVKRAVHKRRMRKAIHDLCNGPVQLPPPREEASETQAASTGPPVADKP
jgi:hypothetical protein